MNNPTELHDDSEPILSPQELAFESRLRSLRPNKLSSQTEELFAAPARAPTVTWRQLTATVAASWVVGVLFGGAAIWVWMSSNRNTSEWIASPSTESQNSLSNALETSSPVPLQNDWNFMDPFLENQESLSARSWGLMRGKLTRSPYQTDDFSADAEDSPNASSVSDAPLTQQEILHDVLKSMSL